MPGDLSDDPGWIDDCPPGEIVESMELEPVQQGAGLMSSDGITMPPEEQRTIVLPHGREARWNEFVRLQLVVTPEPPPYEIQEDDVIVTLQQLARREGMSDMAVRSEFVAPESQGRRFAAPLTAQLAQLLLEGETTKLYSSSPDRVLSQPYRIRFVLLSECGHWAMVEYAELFNRECLAFIAEGRT